MTTGKHAGLSRLAHFLASTLALAVGALAALWLADALPALGAARWIPALWLSSGVCAGVWVLAMVALRGRT